MPCCRWLTTSGAGTARAIRYTAVAVLTAKEGQMAELDDQDPTEAPQPQTTFPSNLANRRNVGQRHGPAFSGQPPLNDIFKN